MCHQKKERKKRLFFSVLNCTMFLLLLMHISVNVIKISFLLLNECYPSTSSSDQLIKHADYSTSYSHQSCCVYRNKTYTAYVVHVEYGSIVVIIILNIFRNRHPIPLAIQLIILK